MKTEKFVVRPIKGGFITDPENPNEHPLLSRLYLGHPIPTVITKRNTLAELVAVIRRVGKERGMVVTVCGAIATRPTIVLRELSPDARSPKPRKGWINNLADVATRLYEVSLDAEGKRKLDELADADATEIASRISRRVYKYTTCGAWMTLLEARGQNPLLEGPPARHANGALVGVVIQRDSDTVRRPERHPNGTLVGVAVGSIVEGCDASTDVHELRFPFTEKQYWAALQEVEDEAQQLWQSGHGCETCAKHWHAEGITTDEWGQEFEGGDGCTPVWSECPDCAGDGIPV